MGVVGCMRGGAGVCTSLRLLLGLGPGGRMLIRLGLRQRDKALGSILSNYLDTFC